MDNTTDFTRYIPTPKKDENPYQWAQTQEVAAAENQTEQIKILHLTNSQNIKIAEVKLFGASGSEENPSPLSVWHGYPEIPATAAWQIERKMIKNPNELDLARTSMLVKAINTYRCLIQNTNELLETYPKDLTEINKFFPEKIKSIQATHTKDVENLDYLRSRETHFKRLLIDIKKNLADGIYPKKLAEPISELLHQLDAPISDITIEVPYVFKERTADEVREALRSANDNEEMGVTRNVKPPKNLAA